MATIRKRGGRYHVHIRKKGDLPITRSFANRTAARGFAKRTKAKIKGLFP